MNIRTKFYYLASLVVVFLLPGSIAALFVVDRIYLRDLIIFTGGIMVLGSFWDIWVTRHGKRDPIWLWQFNDKDTLGIRIFDLPVEEYFFYIISSLYIVFVWEMIKFASETGGLRAYLIVLFLSLWTVLSTGLYYSIRSKNW